MAASRKSHTRPRKSRKLNKVSRISAAIDEYYELPEELIIRILMRLPVKSLCRFKCVCKSWLSLFSNSDFVADHRDVTASNPENHSIGILSNGNPKSFVSFFNSNSTNTTQINVKNNYRSLELVGSYNGLVALFIKNSCEVILWNPATFQSKVVACPRDLNFVIDRHDSLCYSVGMWFDSATKDFKMLSIRYWFLRTLFDDLQPVKAHVYSTNHDCWEKVDTRFNFLLIDTVNEASLSGILYWRGAIRDLGDEYVVYVRYDVKNGVFDHIPFPFLNVKNRNNTSTRLVEWKNHIAILVHSPLFENEVQVVVFDECEREWSTKFGIGPIGIPMDTKIWYFNGTKFLLETLENQSLFLFDFITSNMKEVRIQCAYQYQFRVDVFNYTESLVHLKGMKMVKMMKGGLIQLAGLQGRSY